MALCENAIVRHLATGEIPKPLGSRHPLATPFQAYETLDKPIIVIAPSDDLWANFCRAAEMEAWITDERYKTKDLRLENYNQFDRDMSALMRTRSHEDWVERFEAHDVMYAPVYNIADVTKDPQVNARKMIVELTHPKAGKHRIVNTPLKFSRTPGSVDKAAPELGVDTDDILSNRLGLSPQEIEELKRENVIG